ncbi:hypothetical protein P280DRAFT_194500 [Massarina eburnea CBS 473.64]|uniref:EGF-like domain-containing protein n=1 Tax=Massarina eburnea CBS 473.64 TaxID=1395130 RepID=A0A6A6RLL3_9PLEO|nr:hypothetical protein P280DRAFT_194500 [Massarina eburnea CBS 473.64]
MKLSILPSLLTTTLATCTTDDHCSLNGLCNPKTSTCTCDPGWTGTNCGTLDLRHATRGTGYNHTTTNASDPYTSGRGNSSWGAHILQDRRDPKLFHLITSQFAHGCGLSAWKPFSTVIRGESQTGPQGPYEWKQEILGPWHHNPATVWSEKDGLWLLYTIGDPVTPPTSCKSQSLSNNISVVASPDLKTWTVPKRVLSGATNPAPWPVWSRENDTSEIVLGIEDATIYKAGAWDAEYTLVKTQSWNTSDYSPTWTEDPFLWQDKRGNWHLLVHWMIDISENGVKYPRVGAHLFSREVDGNWTFVEHEAFNTSVEFTDGSRTDYYRRERPKLFFSGDGEVTPLYLVSGVQEFNASGASYTLVQPVGDGAEVYERGLGF